MARKKGTAHHEEHMDEGWLIPYADLLTLLLALFIVLFASSQVDQKKFEQLAQSFNAAFNSSGNSAAILDHNQSLIEPQNQESLQKITEQQFDDLKKRQAHLQETAQLTQLKKELDQYIAENNLSGKLHTILSEDGLLIRIKDSALFPSGSAELIPDSQVYGTKIAKMLKNLSQKVIISGHTDDIPINNSRFPSNWELSSQRAINFMKYLLAQEDLQPERFSAIGYGEYHPIVPNTTSEGRSKNRRVEVLIMRDYKI